MSLLLLVRWPDDVDLPPGTVGVCKVAPPRRYAFVKDEAEFLAWAREEATVTDCGHVPATFTRRTTERAVEDFEQGALPPPGVMVKEESAYRLVVRPTRPHRGEYAADSVWESPVDIVRETRAQQRRRRAQRRRAWTR